MVTWRTECMGKLFRGTGSYSGYGPSSYSNRVVRIFAEEPERDQRSWLRRE